MSRGPDADVRHPLFARCYRWLSQEAEAAGMADIRRELLAGLRGRVVEVGSGNGMNFRHYPTGVEEVAAVEPEPYLRAHAERAASAAPVSVRVVSGRAERLPFPDGTFDAGVASLVLCSVPDQDAALAELRRVVRPGGELRFYEHVRAWTPLLGAAQRVADWAWPLLNGGCHLTRDTEAAITRAFTVERCRRFRFQPCRLLPLTSPVILGVARRY
jgi:SAM-dependent methyltransferase